MAAKAKRDFIALKDQEGFTLMELLVVSGLLAVLAGILYGTTSGILSGRAIVEQQRQNGQIAQYVLERMARELTGRYLIPLANQDSDSGSGANNNFNSSNQTAYAAAGRPAVYFMGIDEKASKEATDRIRFVSANAAQAVYGETPNYGLVEIEYRLEKPDNTTFSARPEDGIETYVLTREEFPAGVNSKEITEGRKFITPLASNLVAMNLRYLKDGNWVDQWDQTRIQLPEAIEITLKLKGGEGQIDQFRTAVAVSKSQRRQ